MSKKLLAKSDYPNIYNEVDSMIKPLKIKNISVYMTSSNRYDGSCGENKIVLTSALIEDFNSYPHVLKFFVGHEIIHSINKEFGVCKAVLSLRRTIVGLFLCRILLHKDNGKRLLSEMRANIDGAALAKLADEEIHSAQKLAQTKNNSSVIPKSYKSGYPDRAMIADYCVRYKKFDESIARIVLNDFCEKMKIKKKEKFIEVILNEFYKRDNWFRKNIFNRFIA